MNIFTPWNRFKSRCLWVTNSDLKKQLEKILMTQKELADKIAAQTLVVTGLTDKLKKIGLEIDTQTKLIADLKAELENAGVEVTVEVQNALDGLTESLARAKDSAQADDDKNPDAVPESPAPTDS